LDKPDYSGMTTNERLHVAGLLDRFDIAAKSRDREAMINILIQVDILNGEAASITDRILAKPRMYGY
jgi:hypothetical protein